MNDAPSGPANLSACHLGAMPYRAGLRLQEQLVAARAAGACGDWLLFPDHPPVLTIGRSPSAGSLRVAPELLARRGIEVFEVARGGDVTWHGPGQVVGYAICHLDRQGRDLHRFLRALEQALIDTLRVFGIGGRRIAGRTGVWVGEQKIASIGVAVRRWVSYHGFALNVSPDLSYFDLIHPCGLRGIRMTSLADRLGAGAPGLARVREVAAAEVAKQLGFAGIRWAAPERLLRIVADGAASNEPWARAGTAAPAAAATPPGRPLDDEPPAVPSEGATIDQPAGGAR